MKLKLSILFLSFALSGFTQQKGFLDYFNPDTNSYVGIFAYSLEDAFLEPEKTGTLFISPEKLDSASKYDFSKLTNLQMIHIQFTLDPASSDLEKKSFRSQTNERLKNLVLFSKCPKLKLIVFEIGEQVYLNEKQCKDQGPLEKADWDVKYKRMIKQNLEGAWNDFGKSLNTKLPAVKLYAFNWMW